MPAVAAVTLSTSRPGSVTGAWRTFSVGSDEARAYLLERKVEPDIARAARLRVGEGITFPWLDKNGEEMYATSRNLNGTSPKYRHQPGTRPALYAGPGAWEASHVALVEGPFDVLAATAAGWSAFGLMSAELSDRAAAILAGKARVLMALDADEAGRRATAQATAKLLGRVELLEVDMPAGYKDLAEVAEHAEDAAEAVAEVLAAARLVLEPDADDFITGDEAAYDWLVDGVLERGDRAVITGREGAGKSLLLQQVCMQVAAGIHPFTDELQTPVRTALVDCENSARELRRRLRPMRIKAGTRLARRTLFVYSKPEGLDLGGSEEDREWLRSTLRRTQAELLCAGPVYKLTDGNPNDEVDMKPVVAFLDELRCEFGISVIVEAHMTHDGKGRPFGWSGWRRWPEIGLELKESGALTHWRTPRHETPGIPPALQRGGEWPFTVATRARDVLWARILERCEQSLSRPTVRELADGLGVSLGYVQKTIEEHRHEWDSVAHE